MIIHNQSKSLALEVVGRSDDTLCIPMVANWYVDSLICHNQRTINSHITPHILPHSQFPRIPYPTLAHGLRMAPIFENSYSHLVSQPLKDMRSRSSQPYSHKRKIQSRSSSDTAVPDSQTRQNTHHYYLKLPKSVAGDSYIL